MRILLYIVLLFVVSACGFSASQSKVLDDAQVLMQSAPSEALSKLNSVDVSEIQDSSILARWALLYSEAMAKNNLYAPTDTIVNIAVSYYGRHNLNDEFQKASQLKSLLMSRESSNALASAIYLQREKEFKLYKERKKREQTVYMGALVFLVALGVILWMRQRFKMQVLRNEALLAQASGMKRIIDDSMGNINRLEAILQNSLEIRFALIDSLCQTYYESQGTKIERKAIVDRVKDEIDLLRNDSFAEMEKAVNECRENLLVKVRNCYPGIKSEEYQLLVYIASGLSARTICLLLGESIDVVYKRKSRLKSHMRELVEPSYPEIMRIF